MEEKSTPDMISMSRPSRENRASKNPKVTADTANIPSSKKSQICASGISPRATRASKKAKTGVETLAGASKATKKPESGSERTDTRSSNLTSGVVSRSKHAAENGGDVTLDALRPAKKQKISEDNGASPSPLLSAGQAKSLKSGENGKHTPAKPATTTGEASPPDSPLGNLERGVGSADITITGQPAEEIKGGSEHQIGSRATRRANGLSGAAEKLKEEQRALRPRPRPTARKVKKRTRFHEVTLGVGDGPRIVGRRIKVFWPLEERYFYGHVKAFNGSKKLQHKIVYDDKDEEWVRLQNEKFGIELEPGEVFGGPALAPATETSAGAQRNELDNSNELTGDAPTAVDDGETDIKAVEGTTTGKGRIKPEGVYRRKRKEERTNEEKTQRSDGAIEREKRGEGDRNAKKKGEGNGENKKKEKGDGKDKNTEKGDGKDKNTGKGDGEDKKREGDSEPKKKTEGASEPKKKLEGEESVRKKGEANNKQRGALADRLGRVNAKRSSGKFALRERRKKGVLVVTSRDRMRKIVSVDGSSGRRKKAGKEKVHSDSSVQIRTRHSNLADEEGQKTLRSRIRDDDRLFPSVKPPNAVIRRKAPESKRSGEPKTLRSSSEAKHSVQAKISQKIASEGEKLVSSFTVNVRERKETEDSPSTGPEANALGPFEAVMDAYREALSDTKDVPSSLANRSPEDHSSEAVREDEKASMKTDCMGDQDDDDREVVGEDLDEASRLTTRASPGPPVAGAIGCAVLTETLQFQEDRQQAGNDLLAGGELNNDGQRMSADLSTSEVVLTPLFPPVTQLRPELKELPDEVYGRVKKYQPDKVYRRLKHTRNKVHNEGVDEPADVSQTVLHASQNWFVARDLPSASHVLSYGARIAALGSSPYTFERTVFSTLQYRSHVEDYRLQLGTFYGEPSMQSLLRVSLNTWRWLFASVLVSNEVGDTSSIEASPLVGRIRKSSVLLLSTAKNQFKRRGMSRSNVVRPVTLLRQLLDPTTDLKLLSSSLVYFRGLGVRYRHLASILRRGSGQSRAPQLASVALESQLAVVMHSINLRTPCGQMDDHPLLTVLRSNALRRSFLLSDPRISSRRSPPTNVVDGEAVEFTANALSVGPFTPLARDECRTCREVGAYYGRPTLQSFSKVTRGENYRMNVRSLSSTHARDGADSVDLRSFLRASVQKNSQPSKSLMGERLVTNEIQLNSASDGGAATDSVSRGELISTDLTVANGQDIIHDLQQTRAHVASVDICRSDDSDPQSLEGFVHTNRRSRGHDIPFMGQTSCLCQDSPSFLPDDIMQLPSEGQRTSYIPFRGPWFIDAFNFKDFSLHVTIPRYFGAIPRSLFIQESSSSTCSLSLLSRNIFFSSYRSTFDEMESARPQDLETNVRQVGTHFGPPSVVSMLRVSREFWSRLLAVQRKVQQPIKFVSASSPTIEQKGVRTDPQPQSSIETVDDDEVSDQEFRAQEYSGAGSGLEPSVVGDYFSSIKPTGRSFGPMKKGRRTGKSLKRSLSQSVGEAVGRDGSGVDRFAEEDLLSGRPYSKRTRVEIENSGAAIPTDNGLETSPVYSDLEGKGFTGTSVSTQEKAKDSRLPRMNVLKLRRCPTNKGVWLVAGNSCGPSQDTELRGPTAEAEQKVPFNSRDQGVGVDPMTPIFETSRKRVLHQSLESPAPGRTDLNRNPPAATVSSTDSQELEMSGLGVKPTKAGSPDIWFDCGIASVNGGVADGPEPRKRQRKGPSPNTGDDVDVISEHSLRRSVDHNWGSCTANVLITKSDRCVRETGAVVELQLRHGNTYMLTVSLHGESQYALKTDQPVPSGTTNKFTHSMMWRGGKAWSLEFVDRKQWQLFKDLHEECFQRNARAASVRHIPIPGVKQIQECPKSGPRYVRPSHKYIRQYDGETEVAFSSTRVVYDMDSEDEEWLNQVNSDKVSARGTRSRAKVDEDTLERVIDKLEKTSYIQQQDAMSAEAAAELCQALGSQEAIKAIHSYWSEKRQRKGMALVRLFQPAPWEQYQKQLQEWQEKIDQLQQQLPTASKQQLQSSCKRPPLFAFCLRPRGLETKNKMQRQRSHRKQGLSSSSSRHWTVPGPTSDFYFDSPSKRQPSVDSTGGPFNGSRKFLRQRIQEGGFSDPMAVDLTESFNAIAGEGFTSVEHAGQAISEGTPVFSRAESGSVQQFETSTTGGFSKRTKKLGRKAKKMKLLAAAEESRRKRLRRAQQGQVNGRFAEMGQSPGSLSDLSAFPPVTDPSTSGGTLPHTAGQDDDKVAIALAAEAFAKAKRETAVTLRSRAQALHAIADAAMHKAVAAVVAADAIHAAERANEDASERGKAQPAGNHRQQRGDVPTGVKDDPSRPWGRSDASGGPSFGSWRRALNSASKNANHILSKGSGSKPGMMSDVDDALLPVASWSQELGAGLGTRLLQTGEVSPQRQRYSPVLVEGISKSPARVRGEGLVSLGRTRGESMMAMLTR